MKDRGTNKEDTWYLLNERAKELNCLYQVDEILGNERLSLSEMLDSIVQVIPAGWQYPEVCHARIVYDNSSYQTQGFCPSSLQQQVPLKMDDKIVGTIEVVYTREVPKSDEGYFLEKERKLICTIADRIGQTLLHRRLKYLLSIWNSSEPSPSASSEWKVIVDLLSRTDPDMLLHVCRRMINYLYWSGVRETETVLEDFSPGWKESLERGEVNYPSAKLPLLNIDNISAKTFAIAQKNLSDTEISLKLQKWLQEQKAQHLIKTVDRIGVSLGEIIDAILRYNSIAGNSSLLNPTTERWLTVALIRRFLSDNLNFIADIRIAYLHSHLDISPTAPSAWSH